MGWFRRKKQEPEPEEQFSGFKLDEASWLPAPQPALEPADAEFETGITILPNGTVRASIETVEEAKQAIKELKLKKKELALEKRQVNAEMADLRTARRLQVANQGSMTRGGGSFGKTIRTFERISRDSAARKHANALAPLEQEKAFLDGLTRSIDKVVIGLERYILERTHAKD